ncbi:hypothetical protein [Nakamurella sp.]|uniref:hypothetical protein n=1 Tax=Nakamurella sp. TaxID=1869182 RepID=UPI0037841954
MREPRYRRPAGWIAGLLCATLLASCGTAPSDVTTVQSTAAGATGQPADTPVSCATPLDATALLPGSAAPSATAAGPPIPVDPEFAQVANVLATGVAAWDSGGLSLVGWGLGELLQAGQQGGDIDPQLQTALTNLSTQMSTISSQLNQISGQLAGITNQIKDATYQTEIQSLTTDHIAPILSMWQDYCEITSTQDTDAASIKNLTSAILDSANGVTAHTTAITEVYTGSQVTGEVALPGMFSTFLVDQGVPPLDDQPLYQQYVIPYAEYFTSLIVMGMTLLTEAYHQQGDTALAEAAVNDLWADVEAIYRSTGAPVSNDAGVLHIPTGTVWSRSPICITAAFDSSDAPNQLNNPDIDQQALAWNVVDLTANSGSTAGAALSSRIAEVAATAPESARAAAPTTPPTGVGGLPTSFTFKTGDRVCGGLWWLYAIPAGNWVPEALTHAGLPSAHLYAGTGDPNSVWRAPVSGDYAALTGARGSATPQDYLNANGFAIPQAGGLYGVPQLGYDYINDGDTGYFDATTGTDTCLFFAQCAGNAYLSYQVVATPQCFLGSAEYKGLPTACGTDWLAAEWPANPPPPKAPPTTPVTSPAGATTPTSTSASS